MLNRRSHAGRMHLAHHLTRTRPSSDVRAEAETCAQGFRAAGLEVEVVVHGRLGSVRMPPAAVRTALDGALLTALRLTEARGAQVSLRQPAGGTVEVVVAATAREGGSTQTDDLALSRAVRVVREWGGELVLFSVSATRVQVHLDLPAARS